jgi:hypothetical protein
MIGYWNKLILLTFGISHDGEKDLDVKIANLIKILEIINQVFKSPLVSRHTRILIRHLLEQHELMAVSHG